MAHSISGLHNSAEIINKFKWCSTNNSDDNGHNYHNNDKFRCLKIKKHARDYLLHRFEYLMILLITSHKIDSIMS